VLIVLPLVHFTGKNPNSHFVCFLVRGWFGFRFLSCMLVYVAIEPGYCCWLFSMRLRNIIPSVLVLVNPRFSFPGSFAGLLPGYLLVNWVLGCCYAGVLLSYPYWSL
jgi:hypothetical protein